jgi:hypothetical protein
MWGAKLCCIESSKQSVGERPEDSRIATLLAISCQFRGRRLFLPREGCAGRPKGGPQDRSEAEPEEARPLAAERRDKEVLLEAT